MRGLNLRQTASKVFRHLAAWGVAVLTLHHGPGTQSEGTLVARGRAQFRAFAGESADLRTLCTNVAQVFAQVAGAQWAAVELHASEQGGGFSTVWAAPSGATEPSPEGSIGLPLPAGVARIGFLRLRRAVGPFTGAETRELVLLAAEAGGLIQVALQLAKATESVVNGERLRLAAQIHHGVAQYLANAVIRLQLSQRSIVEDPSRAQESLHNSLAYAQMAMDAVRATIHALRYAGAELPRIATLLRATTERLRAFTSAEFHLDLDDVGTLSPAIEAVIWVVASEAMTNAAKHAAAHNIYVRLSKNDETITFEVHDDGTGFAYQEKSAQTGNWVRFGLALMKDQIRQVGGTLEIQSVPSGGTFVRALIPERLRRPAPSRNTARADTGRASESMGASE